MELDIWILSGLFSLGFLIFIIYWMVNMLKFTKQNRILMSVQIKMLNEYFNRKGEDIDLESIQNEVEKIQKYE